MLWTCLDIQHIRHNPLVAIRRADFVSSFHDFAVEPRVHLFKSALHVVEPRDHPFKSALHVVEPRVRPFKSFLHVVELRDRPFKPSFDLICLLRDCSYLGFVEGGENRNL